MLKSRLTMVGLASLLALPMACSRESATPVTPTGSSGASNASADGSTLKATTTALSPTGDQALSESPTLTATATMKFGTAPGPLAYRFQVFNDAGTLVADSGQQGSASYRVTQQLDFKKRHTWRARAEYGSDMGPWSAAASFISSEGGYIRGNEVFDPIYNGSTLGEIVGPVTFVPNQGVKLENEHSYIRYTIPQTIPAGEFSMEVMGLRTNAPGGKSKVFAMSSNAPDFITDPFRTDIQYRGTSGSPPNAITFRMLYGDADDLDVRYEPPMDIRYASVRALDPNTTYFWKLTWGSRVQVTVRQGGAKDNGPVLYDFGMNAPDGAYVPSPHYAYLGAPIGRSGGDSATIPGTIYRNVWIGARPRP